MLNVDKQIRSDAATQLAEVVGQLNDQQVRVATTSDLVDRSPDGTVAVGKPHTIGGMPVVGDSGDFGWISHTWDHPNIDEGCATQAYIQAELNQNTAWGSAAAAGGNPTAGFDPAEVVNSGDNPGYPVGVLADANWRGF